MPLSQTHKIDVESYSGVKESRLDHIQGLAAAEFSFKCEYLQYNYVWSSAIVLTASNVNCYLGKKGSFCMSVSFSHTEKEISALCR